MSANTTPDATATPITDAAACFPACNDSSDDMNPKGTHVDVDVARSLEKRLTAAKAEIARLQELNSRCAKDGIGHAHRAERAEAQLRERTQWQCKCGGTDCAGQAENERLRAEVERLSGVKNQLERTGFQTVTQLADAWLNHQNTFKSQTAYVAEVEARETQLRSSVDAMEADKARLDWLERELPREQALLRACTEAQIPVSIFRRNEPITRAAIDAARAGKGAT